MSNAPSPEDILVHLLSSSPPFHGAFEGDFAAAFRIITHKRPFVLVNAVPKSASTFISDVMTRSLSPRAKGMRAFFVNDGRETSLHFPRFLIHAAGGYMDNSHLPVTSSHSKANPFDVALLRECGIRPVLTSRNIADALLSLREQWPEDPKAAASSPHFHAPGAWGDPAIFAAGEEAVKDFLTYAVAPLYVQFYASWHTAENREELPVHWIHYQDFKADPVGNIHRALAFTGQEVPLQTVEDAHTQARAETRAPQNDSNRLRFNKGLSGRGAEYLGTERLEIIKASSLPYHWVDFDRYDAF